MAVPYGAYLLLLVLLLCAAMWLEIHNMPSDVNQLTVNANGGSCDGCEVLTLTSEVNIELK